MVHIKHYTCSLKYAVKMYPSYFGYKISVDQTRKESFIQLDIKKREVPGPHTREYDYQFS